MSKTVLLSGAHGFVGKNMVTLYREKLTYLLDVDSLGFNLTSLDSNSLKNRFTLSNLRSEIPKDVTHILHFGANTSTTSTDIASFTLLNTGATNELVAISCERRINLVIASTAAIYGDTNPMRENGIIPRPGNPYAASKWESEKFVESYCRCKIPHITVLRLFNLYGNYEAHKGPMMSIISRFIEDARVKNRISIFTKDNLKMGSQSRDMVFVNDLCSFTEEYLLEEQAFGLINFGTGTSTSFCELAFHLSSYFDNLLIEGIPMPMQHKLGYQWHTCADTELFNSLFPNFRFTNVVDGISKLLGQDAK